MIRKTCMGLMFLLLLGLIFAQGILGAIIFSDGFESGFGSWTCDYGTASNSATQTHGGSYSYIINEDQDSINHDMGSSYNKVVVVWFYDDASDTDMKVQARVDDGTMTIGFLVDTATSTTKYTYRIGSNYYASNIDRSTGWRQFVWDYRSGSDVKLSIDGTIVYTGNSVTSFNHIRLGDIWADSKSGTVYFDDIEVRDDLPSGVNEFSGDGFESGFGNWLAIYGTPSAVSTQAETGVNSYVMNEGQEAIAHYFPSAQNKVVDIWFYDDASDNTLETVAQLCNGASNATIGVMTSVSASYYVYKINNGSYTSAGVTRTTGWHRFRWDFTSTGYVDMYIDDAVNPFVISTGITSFTSIVLGDQGTNYDGAVYFDNVKILASIPSNLSSEGFENGFDNWAYENGTPSTSSEQKQTGGYSYVINEDTDRITYHTPGLQNKVVEVCFYDDISNSTERVLAWAYNSNGSTVAIGVDKPTSTGYYVYKLGSTYYSTSIPRCTGWHQFIFDYRSGNDVKLYIDNIKIKTDDANSTAFNLVGLGDVSTDGSPSTVYFDDLVITTDVPDSLASFDYDSFENDFANWDTYYGTPTNVTTRRHTGAKSYEINEQRDAIQYCSSQAFSKMISVWFYDDATDDSLKVFSQIYDEVSLYVGIGVNTNISVNYYCYRIGGSYTATNIPRTTGWHQFVFDCRNASLVKLYIDAETNLITTYTTSDTFKTIILGDCWDDSKDGTVYFDDFQIMDSFPISGLYETGFENDFADWSYSGTPQISNAQAHSGSNSLTTAADTAQIIYYYPAAQTNKVVTVWFYDNASLNELKVCGATGDYTTLLGIGVCTNIVSDQYVCWTSNLSGASPTSTGISRSTGWHQLVWDYRTGNDVKLYLDNTIIYTTNAITSFKKICLGDQWSDGKYGAVYFDDLNIGTSLPEGITAFSGDGFENGFANWAATYGTQSTSTDNQHTKYKSYVLDSDQDAITHYDCYSQNKVVSVWFYDDANDADLCVAGNVNDNVTDMMIGVNTVTSASYYSYKAGTAWTATGVSRRNGWNLFTWDYSANGHVDLWINGVLAAENIDDCGSFKKIELGDVWADSKTGTVYFDDLEISDTLPSFNGLSDEDFENGFDLWEYRTGDPSTSTTQSHSGSYSYVMNQDTDRIVYHYCTSQNKVATVWFYDDTYYSNLQAMAWVDDVDTTIAMGVYSETSTEHYSYLIDSTYTATTIDRTTGWHKLVWDYRSGNDVKLYIDNTLIKVSTAAKSFRKIAMGDGWGGSNGIVYFDDLTISDNLPSGITEFSEESFEDGFNYWNTTFGTPTTSNVEAAAGDISFMVNEDRDQITYYSPSANKVVEMWFYDDSSDTDLKVLGKVDDNISSHGVGLGVNTDKSTTCYVYRAGADIIDYYFVTSISRRTGWHQLVWDYRSGVDVDLYIDGVNVANGLTSSTLFKRIAMGDANSDGKSGLVYFDNIKILDILPSYPSFTSDSFENGFANWVRLSGTASASTAQKRSGSYSYVVNEGVDRIQHVMESGANKLVEVWFYDDASDTDMKVFARVDVTGSGIGLGVNTGISTGYYTYRDGDDSNGYTATSVARSTGWHQFIFDYLSGSDVDLYIDGTCVHTSTNLTSFKNITLGDAWADGKDGAVYFDDVIIQDSMPVFSGSITINNNANYCNSLNATLNLSATSATQMKFSNDNINWSTWEDYGSTKSWTLASGADGARWVYAKFKTFGGTVSSVYNDQITLDATPPASFSVTANPNEWSTDTQPDLSFATTDALSGMDHYTIRIDGGDSYTVTSPYTMPVQASGEHTISIKAIDVAGNEREAVTTVYVDLTNPAVSITSPLNEATVYKTFSPIVINVSASDGISGIDKVEFYIDDVLISTDTVSPYSYSWDISGLTLGGAHEITVKAYDEAGNTTEYTINVTVADVIDIDDLNLLPSLD